MTLIRRVVINPALTVPIKTDEAASRRLRARLTVCPKCPFYAYRNGSHRCLHIDRECERLSLRRASETCPEGLWKGIT